MNEDRASKSRTDESFFRRLADLMARREPVILVTVAAATGSVPGKAGAKMIVTPSGQHGTVGGGRIEKAAIEHARGILAGNGDAGSAPTRGPELVRYHLVRDLGMTCGGSVTLLYEPMPLPPRLVIFGAGHVSESLCTLASLSGFDVTVCDERPEWLTGERFPDARERVLSELVAAVDRVRIDPATFVISLSPGHAFDLDVVSAILGKGLQPRYLGVIGSRRKAIEMRKALAARGFDPGAIDRVRIPIGLNIGAIDPREIAVSVVAELVAERRGVDRIEPW